MGVLIAAVDTGLFEMSCNASALPNSSYHKPINMDCDSWKPPIVGTMDHFDHIILSNLGVWSKGSNATLQEEAVRLFSRSPFAGKYVDLPNISFTDASKYYEANILGNPKFPAGISFLIGN